MYRRRQEKSTLQTPPQDVAHTCFWERESLPSLHSPPGLGDQVTRKHKTQSLEELEASVRKEVWGTEISPG